jgi:8-oxo-dGTP diphosphatase
MNFSDYPKHIVTVSALVRNAVGHVLMVRSPRRGWEFPGGQVEEGETLLDALRREVQEETGVDVAVGALVGVYSNLTPPTKVTFGFLCDYVSGELTTSDESLESGWVERPDVLPRITHPAIYDRMNDMLTFSGRVIYRIYTTNPYHILEERFIS